MTWFFVLWLVGAVALIVWYVWTGRRINAAYVWRGETLDRISRLNQAEIARGAYDQWKSRYDAYNEVSDAIEREFWTWGYFKRPSNYMTLELRAALKEEPALAGKGE